jgi:hypothetical protein
MTVGGSHCHIAIPGAATATLPFQGTLWELMHFCWPELDVVE